MGRMGRMGGIGRMGKACNMRKMSSINLKKVGTSLLNTLRLPVCFCTLR